VGMLPFPVTFLLTDVLNEFYGPRPARFVTFLAFGMAILAFVIIYVAGAVPIAEFTRAADWQGVNEATFANVFLGSQRMLLASLAAFIVSQLVDIAVFHALKRWSGRRLLWLRASGSTAVSQLVDTVVITFVAWSGVLPPGKILNIIVSAYGLKVLIALGLTPAIYLCHALVIRGLGLEPIRLDAANAASQSSDA
ncbi:MAG TPA: queuosine precursor transporter, partial [Polyangiaceae bacterium]|nr:queuosine precursor transporter [Polyangiaceae bacterium]